MLEEKIDSEKGKCFPPSHTNGGVIMPYSPTKFEREHCSYAPDGHDCSKVKTGPIGGEGHTIRCGECPYHPNNCLIG